MACPRAGCPFDEAEQGKEYPTLYTLQMLALADRLQRVAARHTLLGAPGRLHVGIHCGPAAGAVVGAVRAFYCLYGDAVNTAARMCKYAGAAVHASADFAAALESARPGQVRLMSRGIRNIKGKGPMETFEVEVLDGFGAAVELRAQYAAGGAVASALHSRAPSLGEWIRGGGRGAAAALLDCGSLSADGRRYLQDRAHRIDPAFKVFRDPAFERKFKAQTIVARRLLAVAAVLLHILALGLQWHEVLRPEFAYDFSGPGGEALRDGRAAMSAALSYHLAASGLCSLALLVIALVGWALAEQAWCAGFVIIKLAHVAISLVCYSWFPGDGWLVTFPVQVDGARGWDFCRACSTSILACSG